MAWLRGAARVLERHTLAVLVALDVLVRLSAALRPLRYLDGLTIPDDAYLSLTIARGFARGLGPFFETGFTSGFQPLYVFLVTPLFWIFPHDALAPVRGALLLLVVCDVLALVLLWRFLGLIVRSNLAAAVAALAWVLSPYALQTTLNGLETTLAFALLVATFLALELHARAAHAAEAAGLAIGTGVVLGLAAFARVDALLAAPVIAVGLFANGRRRGTGWRAAAAAPLAAGAGAFAIYLPWVLYLHRATGDWLPVSGRALHAMGLADVGNAPGWRSLYQPMLVRALNVLARKDAFPLALILLLLAALAWLRPRAGWLELARRAGPLAPAAAFGALLLVAYVSTVYAGWYYPRYFFPWMLPLLLLLAVLVDACVERLAESPARGALAAVLVAVVVIGNVAQPPFRKTFRSIDDTSLGYMNVGLWTRAHFPPGTVIGGLQCGAMAYFADSLVVVNLDGVVNREAYAALRRRQLTDYIRAAGIRYVIGQREDRPYLLAATARPRPDDLVPLGRAGTFSTQNDGWTLYRVGGEP